MSKEDQDPGRELEPELEDDGKIEEDIDLEQLEPELEESISRGLEQSAAGDVAEVGGFEAPLPVQVDLARLRYQAASRNSLSVRVLQDLLEESGYAVGGDKRGWLSDGTVAALREFQTAAGLVPTGLADEQTVAVLFDLSTRYVWDR